MPAVKALHGMPEPTTHHRVDPGLTATTARVDCRESGRGETAVGVRYTFVGITEAGNDFVRQRDDAEFAAKMVRWEESIREAVSQARG